MSQSSNLSMEFGAGNLPRRARSLAQGLPELLGRLALGSKLLGYLTLTGLRNTVHQEIEVSAPQTSRTQGPFAGFELTEDATCCPAARRFRRIRIGPISSRASTVSIWCNFSANSSWSTRIPESLRT